MLGKVGNACSIQIVGSMFHRFRLFELAYSPVNGNVNLSSGPLDL